MALDVQKRRVTMWSSTTVNGKTVTQQAVDFVPQYALDVYVADARSRWQHVEVSNEADAGPGGILGITTIPDAVQKILGPIT